MIITASKNPLVNTKGLIKYPFTHHHMDAFTGAESLRASAAIVGKLPRIEKPENDYFQPYY